MADILTSIRPLLDAKVLDRAAKYGLRVERFDFVNTSGVSEEEAALRWIETALGRSLERPLHEALKNGVALCEMVNLIRPGCVSSKLLKVSDLGEGASQGALARAQAEGCGRIDAYLV